MRAVSLLLICISACTASAACALQLDEPVPLEIGGRVAYGITVQRDASEFPWNFASNSEGDLTRLMLDVKAGSGRMGELYLKGAALRTAGDDVTGGKLFRFEQGDYFWQGNFTLPKLRFRIYANERRYFTHSLIAPLLDDERQGDSGENIGARFDGSLTDRFGVTALYSALGHELDRSSKIAYVRTAFSHDGFALSTSYVHKNKPDENLLDQAIFKTELSAYYKLATLIVAYEQSGRGRGLFFPSANFEIEEYVGDNFSRVLPAQGAFFAEARLAALPVRQWGTVNLVHRYFALKKSFLGNYIEAGSGTAGYTTGAYFLAKRISLNGRLVYHKSVRSRLDDETRENIEASVWARLKNDSEVFLRCGMGETSGSLPFTAKENFIHGAWQYGKKKLRTGVHFMLKDLDTIFSERRFAWDCKLSFGGNMAIYWRAVIAHDARPRDAIYARFEYRPSRRLYLTAGYGRSIFGDAPFLLEDADIQAMREVTPLYAFTIRGDF